MNNTQRKELEPKDILQVGDEKFFVSTAKMKVHHSWLTQHLNANIYETMIFNKQDDQSKYDSPIYSMRYTSYDNAIEGHKHIIKNIEKIIPTCRELSVKLVD